MDFHQIFDFRAHMHPIWPPTTPTMFYSGAPLIVWPGPVQAIYFVYLALGLPHSIRLSTFPTFFIKISSTFRFFAHVRTCFWSSPPTRGCHHPPSLIGHTFHPFLIDCPSISTHYSICSGLPPTPISMSGLRALTCSSIHPPPCPSASLSGVCLHPIHCHHWVIFMSVKDCIYIFFLDTSATRLPGL